MKEYADAYIDALRRVRSLMADAARNITIKVLLDEAKARMGLKQIGDDADDTGFPLVENGCSRQSGDSSR